jgi:hypothetical protein
MQQVSRATPHRSTRAPVLMCPCTDSLVLFASWLSFVVLEAPLFHTAAVFAEPAACLSWLGQLGATECS